MNSETVPGQITRLAKEVGARWQQWNEAGAVEKMRDASIYFGLRPGLSGISGQKLLDVHDHHILRVGDLTIIGWKRINRRTDNALLAVSPCLLEHVQDGTLASDLYLPTLGINLI